MQTNIRCIVADDEPLAVQLLANYIQKTPACELVFKSTNILHVLKYLETNNCDLIFLDIQMPELTGIQFLKLVQDKSKFIFTTAYPEYALQSYEYDVLDYLVKPITYERFLMSIQKYKRSYSIVQTISKQTE